MRKRVYSHKMKSKLSYSNQQLLAALLASDVRTATAVAHESGLDRGNMLNAIAGTRGISSEALKNLFHQLGIDEYFKLLPGVRLCKIGPDIQPLVTILTLACATPVTMQWVKDNTLDEFSLAHATDGLFIFHFNTRKGAGIVLCKRDPFWVKRGERLKVQPENARAMLPLEGDPWELHGGSIESSKIIFSDDQKQDLHHLFDTASRPAQHYELLNLGDLLVTQSSIFRAKEPTISWDEVRNLAELSGVSPIDVAKWIRKKAIKKNRISTTPHPECRPVLSPY